MHNSASCRSYLATAGLALPAVGRAFVVHQASPKAAIQVMQKLRDSTLISCHLDNVIQILNWIAFHWFAGAAINVQQVVTLNKVG